MGSSSTPAGELKLDTVGSSVTVDVADFHTVAMQLFLMTGSYGSAVVTMERSIDRMEYVAMSPAETLSANGIGNLHDVRGASSVRAVVTTAGTSGARARVSLVAWSE